MPIHRRKVYFEHGLGLRSRMEGWFSYSIFTAAGILIIGLIASFPDILPWIQSWLAPHNELADPLAVTPAAENWWATVGKILMVVSGAYLFLALMIGSNTRHGPQ